MRWWAGECAELRNRASSPPCEHGDVNPIRSANCEPGFTRALSFASTDAPHHHFRVRFEPLQPLVAPFPSRRGELSCKGRRAGPQRNGREIDRGFRASAKGKTSENDRIPFRRAKRTISHPGRKSLISLRVRNAGFRRIVCFQWLNRHFVSRSHLQRPLPDLATGERRLVRTKVQSPGLLV
jgi:hypothetical protein